MLQEVRARAKNVEARKERGGGGGLNLREMRQNGWGWRSAEYNRTCQCKCSGVRDFKWPTFLILLMKSRDLSVSENWRCNRHYVAEPTALFNQERLKQKGNTWKTQIYDKALWKGHQLLCFDSICEVELPDVGRMLKGVAHNFTTWCQVFKCLLVNSEAQ